MKLKHLGIKVCPLLLLLFVLFFPSFADSTNTSLKAIWENQKLVDSVRFKALSQFYILNNQIQPDSTLLVLEYYHRLAKEKNNLMELYNVANDRGGIYRLKGETELAMRHYKEAEQLAKSLKNDGITAIVQGNLGNVYANQKDYKSAIQQFYSSYTIFKRLGDLKGESHMLMSLGTVYLNIQDFDVATEYYREALAIMQNVEVPERRKAVVYLNLGWINYERKKFADAILNYDKALKILEKTQDKFFLVSCYSTLAKIYIEKKDVKNATLFAGKNQTLCEELKVFDDLIDSRTIFARLDLIKGNTDAARIKGESILAELDNRSGKELKLNLYDLLYKCYQAENNPEKSLKMFQNYTRYKDSIQSELNKLAVVREGLKIQFNNILEEKRLKNEKDKAMQESVQRTKTYGLIGASFLFLAVIAYYFHRNLQAGRKKREELMEELNRLKSNDTSNRLLPSQEFQLVREKIEKSINRKLNDTDWNVLNILLKEPDISNKEIAEKAFMSVDGIGSSLRRMYLYFDIKESKYKKFSLIMEAIRASGN
jgi:tetratricopeptide (TPR) repeat protein